MGTGYCDQLFADRHHCETDLNVPREYPFMKHIHRQVLQYVRSGTKVVLATVIRSTGSTPQKPGSSALFGRQGLLAGTVGGGMLEGGVQSIAVSALDSGLSGQYDFNLDSVQGEEGALCGGETTVLVDADPGVFLKVFEDLERTIAGGSEGILVTVFPDSNDKEKTIRRYWIPEGDNKKIPSDIDPDLRHAMEEHLRQGIGRHFLEITLPPDETGLKRYVFFEKIRPLPRLIIAGAGHVGRALAHLGSLLDFEVTVVDDRKEYASRENITDAHHLVIGDVGQSMRELPMGDDTYVVIVTRGHNHDAEALKTCIGSGAAYVGMIGSRHKVATMRMQFLQEGWATTDQWDAIHTPIGIEIGSKTVQEIAVSIAAQLVQERNRKNEAHAT